MRSQCRSVVSLSVSLSALAVSVFAAAPAWTQNGAGSSDPSSATAQNAVPAFVGQSRDLGPADPHSTITISLHLRTPSGLDAALQRLYDPASPDYQQWLSSSQVAAALAATAADAATARQFLAAHHLKEVGSGPAEIFAQGTIADVQAAFNTAIHLFDVNGRIVRANTSPPTISGAAGAAISSIGGLADHRMRPHWTIGREPDGTAFAPVPLGEAANGAFFSAQCFRPPERDTFTSSTATATYFGNRYGQNIDNAPPNAAPCGYQPSDVSTAYHLTPLYNAGLDGTGETIAIVDAYGSTTIQTDAAVFSAFYGLPAVDLTVIGTPTASPFSTDTNLAGWAVETTLDVEWAHAIAPGAKIVLIVSPDNTDANLAAAVAQAAALPGVVVISNSYGGPESQEDAAGFAAFEKANKAAAARGISVDYSSGDDGDYVSLIGYTDVSYPASSPWATAQGGVSVGVGADGSISFQTGWGANITKIAENAALGNAPTVPPLQEGFYAGAGGGPSAVFAKPSFQWRLPGRTRLVPDVSWIADPYTGVEIIFSTDDTGQNFGIEAIGGTSVAAPMFSGLWSIVVQRAGHKLGQAARTLYRLSPSAITDVLPAFSLTNPFGIIQTSSSKRLQIETPYALAAPLEGNRTFYSAIYNSPFSTRWFVLTFGTDSSLEIGPGWDEVTGLGAPNGATFVEEAAGAEEAAGH